MTDYMYAAKLDRVVDGDTVWLVVDLGFGVQVRLDFRLQGINAPELRGAARQAGEASKAALQGLLTAGVDLEVTSFKSEKYGRWLAQLDATISGARVNVNQTMIAEGFAVAYDGHGPRP